MHLPRDVVSILIKNKKNLKKFVRPDGRILVKLKKALYGLKTAGRDWYEKLKQTLETFGYKQSEVDPCLFIGENIHIFTYVDDFLCIGSDTEIEKFSQNLTSVFGKLKEQRGSSISYLGMNIVRDANGNIRVNQKGYIEKLCNEYAINKVSKHPASGNIMHKCANSTTVDEDDYLSLVMKIMYVATRTRPDILFPTVILASRCSTHLEVDYNRLIKILKYLYGSMEKGLSYNNKGEIAPRMFVDAGFQTHGDAKGHTGFVIFPDLLSGGILFRSKKQSTVSQSSAEAELIALSEAVTYLVWVINIYAEFGIFSRPVEVFEDNKSTIAMAMDKQVAFKGRSKFIDRKFFSVYEHIDNGDIKLAYVGTETQIADYFTKVILGERFEKIRYSIMGSDWHEEPN